MSRFLAWRPPASPAEAWYHVDFCHAYAWVYEGGDQLRVRWGERDRENLYLHSSADCDRCAELMRTREPGRYGEFTMAKPDAKFSSAEAFFYVLAEIAEYVPGLKDGAGEGSRPSSPVAPDGPDKCGAGRGSDTTGAAARNSRPTKCSRCKGLGLTGERDEWGIGKPCPNCDGTGES